MFEQYVNNFSHWGGGAGPSISSTALRLRYQNPLYIPGLDFSGRRFHYRPGTTGNYKNQPDDGRDLQLVGSGISFVGGDNAGGLIGTSTADNAPRHLVLPGSASEYVFLHEDEETPAPAPPYPAESIGSWWFSAWVTLSTTRNYQVLMGGDFSVDPTLPDLKRSIVELSARRIDTANARLWRLTLSMHTVDRPDHELYLASSAQVDSASTSVMNHLLVQTYFVVEGTLKTWHCRWFWNGVLVGHTHAPVNDGVYRWWCHSTSGLLRASMQGMHKPALLAMRHSVSPWSEAQPYGAIAASAPFTGYVDEVMMGTGFPVLDGDGQPAMYLTQTDGQEVFRPRRFPDPSVVGINSLDLVAYSPVLDTGYTTAEAAIKQVYLLGTANQPGQTISVSVRASIFSFSADNAVLPWSDWMQVQPATNGSINGWYNVPHEGGGRGRWVQVRVRLTPSHHPAMQSPTLSNVGVRADIVRVGSATADLPASIVVSPTCDLPARMMVRQSGKKDLPARIVARFAGTPKYLGGRLHVRHARTRDLPARIVQSLHLRDLPARIEVPYRTFDLPAAISVYHVTPGHRDWPARLNVLRNPLYPQVGRNTRDLPAAIDVKAWELPARLVVQRRATKDLPAGIAVEQDIPGSVEPLTCNVPRAVWQQHSRVEFSWMDAAWNRLPITSYYWTLSRSATAVPDASWHNRDTNSVEIELNQLGYGSGVWYFHVAARNTGGYFGPVSTYEVWWNSPPPAPGGEFMRVLSGHHELDCTRGAPIVSYADPKRLRWSVAYDRDAGEVLQYQVQIATRPDFLPDPVTGVASIVTPDSFVFSDSVCQFTDLIKPGDYFWRVRAYDGKQYSEWSPYVGAFRVNDPPTRPIQTVVSQP